MEHHLNRLYYDIKEPSSYRGIKNILEILKEKDIKYNTKDVSDWLKKQETYGVFSQPKHKFKRNPIVSKYIDHNWQADLIETKNSKFKFVLIVIDNLSKYAWAELLLNKTANIVKTAFLKIFRESKRKPTILSTDAGREFTNNSLKRYLKWRRIKHLVLRDHSKASTVERLNQTLKNKINKHLNLNKRDKIDDILI